MCQQQHSGARRIHPARHGQPCLPHCWGVADNASVQVDGDGPDVYINATGTLQGSVSAAGELYCGSDPSTTSWQPGSYSITGDLCACTQQFESEGDSTACDSCGGSGWDGELCTCEVRGKGPGNAPMHLRRCMLQYSRLVCCFHKFVLPSSSSAGTDKWAPRCSVHGAAGTAGR